MGFFTPQRILCGVITIVLTLAVILAIVVAVTIQPVQNNEDEHIWSYECRNNRCVKVKINRDSDDPAPLLGLLNCRQQCGLQNTNQTDSIWPMPTGDVISSSFEYAQINEKTIKLGKNLPDAPKNFWQVNLERLQAQVVEQLRNSTNVQKDDTEIVDLTIEISVKNNQIPKLTTEIDESYQFKIELIGSNDVVVTINAPNIYGARHALESVAQMVFYDDINRQLWIRHNIEVNDEPVYKFRSILLDTSRNYFTVDSIKRVIDTMALVKLNVFHWHITDSQSWPIVIRSHPYLSKYGAYSSKQIYTPQDVRDIVEFARLRGVVVIPELDAPGHVGEGWQFTNFTTCFNKQPWTRYCVSQPCGQFNPTINELYDVIEDIYGEYMELFDSPEIFHMGGDEVHTYCWESDDQIVEWMLEKGWEINEGGFMKLWGHFQDNALERLDRVATNGAASKAIMWTSTLTQKEYVDTYLDNKRYIIQIWTKGDNAVIGQLLEKGYELIMSNYDALYLDCGFESWYGKGNNWCSPYHGWHEIYDNDLKVLGGTYHHQIIGAEGAVWSEQADEKSIDGRLWPRSFALSERLWTDPKTDYSHAESRILLQRERFVLHGVRCETLQPEWCVQNEGDCPWQ